MRKLTIVILAAGIAGVAANCSPFDPILGEAPYLCADIEPRCPENYSCINDGVGKDVCVAAGGNAPDSGSGGGFQCAADGPLEPNDSIQTAFVTDVGTGAPSRMFGPVSICPEGDKDHFTINLTTPNKGIEAITTWETGMPIAISILNAGGTSISNGTMMGTNALRACAPNLPVGTYYASAFSSGGLKNNYRIELKVVDACI